jgi:putrescine---pyruvate transaminase
MEGRTTVLPTSVKFMTGPLLHAFAKPSKTDFISIVRGKGSLLWDANGRQYIDAIGSLWYCQVGHGRTEIAEAVAAQISTLETYSTFDPFTNQKADELAAKLQSISALPQSRVFLCGSGSEAVDTAMKLARVAQGQAGHPERTIIISRMRGYHGTNYGGTSAQGLPLNKQGFGQLLPEVVQVDSDNLEDLAKFMSDNSKKIAAVIVEPLQGAGGVWPPPPGYLEGARKLCDQHGAFLIFDEVISGFGRMGTWFAADHYGVIPDMLCFAKGVTSGYQPLGGVYVGAAVREALESDPNFFLRHGYTYSGHSSVCAAALANLAIIEREGLVERAKHVGARLSKGLGALATDGTIDHVRGDGAVWAAGLKPDQNSVTIRDRMIELGVIARAINTDTVAFCPPLVVTDEELDTMIDTFANAAMGK